MHMYVYISFYAVDGLCGKYVLIFVRSFVRRNFDSQFESVCACVSEYWRTDTCKCMWPFWTVIVLMLARLSCTLNAYVRRLTIIWYLYSALSVVSRHCDNFHCCCCCCHLVAIFLLIICFYCCWLCVLYTLHTNDIWVSHCQWYFCDSFGLYIYIFIIWMCMHVFVKLCVICAVHI